MIFESHAHYDDEAFDEDRKELLDALPAQGIGRVINVCAEVEGWDRTLDLMERYIGMSVILLVTFLFITAFWNIYSGILRRNFRDEFRSVFGLIAGLFVALTLYCFVTKKSEDYSRAVLLTFIFCALPVVYLERLVWKEYIRKRVRRASGEVLLFIDEENIQRKIELFTDKANSGVIVTGIITYEKSECTQVQGIPIVGWREELY